MLCVLKEAKKLYIWTEEYEYNHILILKILANMDLAENGIKTGPRL